jgi:ppGpp synthetase/RelA/SpoT-type nucleotidyltranferase
VSGFYAGAAMTANLSKTQIDRLGDRLKKNDIEEADLRLLDLYRRSFAPAYEFVVGAIRKELTLEPTGRPSKTTTSISDKLRRESIRLTQIQDIAGCRLIVADIATQNTVIQSLSELFEHTAIVDRRERPSHGYRTVHVIVKIEGVAIEVQVRTLLQQLRAELSEKLSDIFDSSIKYGGGEKLIKTVLDETSSAIAKGESLEIEFVDLSARLSSRGMITEETKQIIIEGQRNIEVYTESLEEFLRDSIEKMKS